MSRWCVARDVHHSFTQSSGPVLSPPFKELTFTYLPSPIEGEGRPWLRAHSDEIRQGFPEVWVKISSLGESIGIKTCLAAVHTG
jgi:hypothetical protein